LLAGYSEPASLEGAITFEIAERSWAGQDGEVLPNQQQHDDPDATKIKRLRLLTPSFNVAGHYCAIGAISLTAIALGAWLARQVSRDQLWVVPAYLLVANVVEYLVHRFLMHRPLWPRSLYRGHTLGHHRAFHHDSMAIQSWREIELVVMPWFTIALFFAALTPVMAIVYRTMGPGAVGLLLLTSILSFVIYEGLHTLYHLPPPVLDRAGVSRNRLFQFLLHQHRHHHRLVRMRWANFNISLPVSDRLLGTWETEATWLAERDRRRAGRRSEQAAASADEQAAHGSRVTADLTKPKAS